MTALQRRTLLAAVAGAAAAPLAPVGASPAAAADVYGSNTELYRDPTLSEGVDYARRYRRHGLFDNDSAQRFPVLRTAIVALHGGGIEPGTSELCLAIAGYRPDTLAAQPAEGPTYDYWLFEGIGADNDHLHVTSSNCDDVMARSTCAGALNVVSLHGCGPTTAGLPAGTQMALVGGRNAAFRRHLLDRFAVAGVPAMDASAHPSLSGTSAENIVNRTLLGMGAQLEITLPLRAAMFGTNTLARRRHTTLPLFWSFTGAVREAIALLETSQPIR